MTIPLRFSALKNVGRSLAHAKDYIDNGRDDKPWLRDGRNLHAVLFGTPYVLFDGASRRGKAWDVFVEAHESVYEGTDKPEIILAKDLPIYQAQAESIRRECARQGLSYILEGDIEKRIEWSWLGRHCAGTPDVAAPLHVTDVKGTANADPRRFHWDARKFGYAEQLQWYHRGVISSKLAGQFDPDDHLCIPDLFIVACERTSPYPVVIWRLTEKLRIQAEKTLRLWLEQFLASESSDCWPGYVQTVQDLDVLNDDSVTLQIVEEEVEVE